MTLTPADIRVHWASIKEDLGDACGSYPIEEVYAACRSGSAQLYTCPEGFVILEGYTAESTGLKEVNILAASATSAKNMLDTYIGAIRDIARDYGAKTLVFRRLKDSQHGCKGWKLRASEYVMEI